MTYRVHITASALDDLSRLASHLAAETESSGADWYDRLLDHIFTLADFPARCPIVDADSGNQGMEIRCLLFGRRQHQRRILFAIVGPAVQVLQIVHGARDRQRSC